MQLVASVVVLVVGLVLALVVHTTGDMHVFGWVLVAIGVLGFATGWVTKSR